VNLSRSLDLTPTQLLNHRKWDQTLSEKKVTPPASGFRYGAPVPQLVHLVTTLGDAGCRVEAVLFQLWFFSFYFYFS